MNPKHAWLLKRVEENLIPEAKHLIKDKLAHVIKLSAMRIAEQERFLKAAEEMNFEEFFNHLLNTEGNPYSERLRKTNRRSI